MKRDRRNIEGDLFGAPGVAPLTESNAGGPRLELPKIEPKNTPEVIAVREAPSTSDARVDISSYYPQLDNGKTSVIRRYRSAACPDCGWEAHESNRANARQAYVLHRAQERHAIAQPDLIPGIFPGELKPWS